MTRDEAFRRLEAVDRGKLRADPDLDALEAELRLLAHCDALDVALTAWADYRLAHVLVRQATRKADNALLLDAELHLASAARAELFGSWPDLYRLAIRARLEQPIERALRALVDRFRPVDEERASLQDPAVNALEALTYALGLDPAVVDGVGAPHGLGEGAWIVAWPEELPAVRMGWALAAAEVRARALREPDILAFLLGPDGPRIRRPRGRWTRGRKGTLELLGIRGLHHHWGRDQVKRSLDPRAHGRGGRFSSRVNRAREDLLGIVAIDEELILEGAPLLGAVYEQDAWR